MHREQAIETLRFEEGIIRDCELNPNQKGFAAADKKEQQSVAYVHQTDLLVIDSRHPVVKNLQKQPAFPGRSYRFGSFQGRCFEWHPSFPFDSAARSTKHRHIVCDGIDVVWAQMHGGHKRAGLGVIGIVDPRS